MTKEFVIQVQLQVISREQMSPLDTGQWHTHIIWANGGELVMTSPNKGGRVTYPNDSQITEKIDCLFNFYLILNQYPMQLTLTAHLDRLEVKDSFLYQLFCTYLSKLGQ